MNQVQHLEDNENNGFRMKNILAVNQHWHDVLLKYHPTKLRIDLRDSNIDRFMQKLGDKSLDGLKHVRITRFDDRSSTDKKKLTEVMKILNQKNFSLTSLVLAHIDDCETNMPDLMEFFDKHCLHLEKLKAVVCHDLNHNENYGPFVSIISRTGFYDTYPPREINFISPAIVKNFDSNLSF